MFECVFAVVAVLQEYGFCFDHCGSADWKRAFSRQEQNQSTVALLAYIQNRDGVSYCMLFFKLGPPSTGRVESVPIWTARMYRYLQECD